MRYTELISETRRLGGFVVTPVNIQDENIDEAQEHSPVASAVTRRIMTQRHDLLSKYGPISVTAAIDNVADNVGDVDEIGSSDVSGWVMQVERMLKENPPEAFSEAIKLNAPARVIPRDELQGYTDRIKTGTKTKRDKFAPIIHGSNIKAITQSDDPNDKWDLDDLARQITTRPRTILSLIHI